MDATLIPPVNPSRFISSWEQMPLPRGKKEKKKKAAPNIFITDRPHFFYPPINRCTPHSLII